MSRGKLGRKSRHGMSAHKAAWFYHDVQQEVFHYLLEIAKDKGVLDDIPELIDGDTVEDFVDNFKLIIDTIVEGKQP